MTLASTPDIIAELKAGRMVILVDEEDRENEGDLVLAAEFVTPEAINFMARYGRGLICLTLTQERCKQLNLPLMTYRNGTQYGTAFTVSIEAAEGVTTGISAADRARTIATAVAHDVRPEHIVQPGHVRVTTSSVLSPIEPVEPSNVRRFCIIESSFNRAAASRAAARATARRRGRARRRGPAAGRSSLSRRLGA